MMKKKLLALGIVFALTLSLLCGCTVQTPDEVASGAATGATQTQPDSSGETADSAEEDYYDVGDAEGLDADEYAKYKNSGSTGQESGGATQATNQDKYYTDPVPEGMPLPVEKQDVEIDEGTALTCTLLIDCSTILDNMGKLKAGKEEVLPSNGVVYAKKSVTFYKGESVFDVLLQETQKNRIHMEYDTTPVYNSNYVEGINNLYEYDCGNLSGWMYNVNAWYPNYGCSRYQLQDGDAIEWRYTCDLGRDLGAGLVEQKG